MWSEWGTDKPSLTLTGGMLWDGHTSPCRWLMFLLSGSAWTTFLSESKYDISQFEGQIWGKTSDQWLTSLFHSEALDCCCLICLKVNTSMVTTLFKDILTRIIYIGCNIVLWIWCTLLSIDSIWAFFLQPFKLLSTPLNIQKMTMAQFIYLITILKYYYNLKLVLSILIYFQMYFFPVISAASVTWTFRNHSNMLILCSRNILLSMLKTVV